MKVINIKCPNCSANLDVAPNQMKVHCPYCGSSLLIESNLPDITEKEKKKQAKTAAKADKKRSKQQIKIEKKKLKEEREQQ